ncbi:hypothetical protein SDJN02_26522, partial [Cucurbita argyrosperma subsp. argyrosperma]
MQTMRFRRSGSDELELSSASEVIWYKSLQLGATQPVVFITAAKKRTENQRRTKIKRARHLSIEKSAKGPSTGIVPQRSLFETSLQEKHDNMSAHRKIYRISNMAKLKYMKNYTYIQIDEDVEQYRY